MNEQLNREDCEAVVQRLWPHLDGMLPDSDRERVIQHLESCAACQSHFDFAKAFLEAVAAAQPEETPNPALLERVLKALSGEGFAR